MRLVSEKNNELFEWTTIAITFLDICSGFSLAFGLRHSLQFYSTNKLTNFSTSFIIFSLYPNVPPLTKTTIRLTPPPSFASQSIFLRLRDSRFELQTRAGTTVWNSFASQRNSWINGKGNAQEDEVKIFQF